MFSNVYNLHSIGLRYFNLYDPKQDPNNPHASVVPLFVAAALKKKDQKYLETELRYVILSMLKMRYRLILKACLMEES